MTNMAALRRRSHARKYIVCKNVFIPATIGGVA
jgi:hypothetical protein